MDSGSPIKSWIRRHSPIKSRSKPLPAAPNNHVNNGSPSRAQPRQPGRVISANASPTRPRSTDPGSTHKVTKRKISSLWKAPQQTPTDALKSKHRRVVSSPVNYTDERPSSSNSVESLSERVTTLEAQLRAAKADLAQASHVIKAASPFKARPSGVRRAQSYESTGDIDRHVEERQRSLQRGNYYDGVVESLLQQDYAAASRKSLSYSTRGSPERRSASATGYYEKAMSDYKNLEDDYVEDGESRHALEIARRRSELRALEWRRMQDHMTSQGKSRVGSKRSQEDASVPRDERPARRQKHESNVARDKALPEIPQRSTRAVSERNERGLEESQSKHHRAVSSAHTIQYVSLRRADAPESPSKSAQRSKPSQPDIGDADNMNVTVYSGDDDDEAEEYAPPSPYRRHIPSPSRLPPVSEEFEWNDDEIF